ncbi:peroxisomal membrane anchor protein conserved region-domain-containing protein [Zychaea mexicana]|uniref:peroxisomal membrane anchor protein conserved region-domain-containing protein n=1 Tax=Zychaea mexicana TaxID=64656 RepID=UPI0022FE1269|nr:peroxisomal membrane anchor protein conserved region-domain-containing protein [Zychaea mexicana]KAI9491039.1 peroxisomal membrane anchor protein conserved region-domain-containing protein [Zychaea mexicana]
MVEEPKNNSSNQQTALSNTSPPSSSSSNTTTAATATAPNDSSSAPLNEQLIKSAVSFLSSPNVKSAETVKKVAFLQKKGLNPTEIQEAFKRVDEAVPSVPAGPTASSPATAPSAPLIPTRPVYQQQQPSIVYQPLPPAPAMPIQRLVAIALLFGVGTVSVTAGVVGIVKRLLLPTFNAVTAYRTGRYKQQTTVLDKLGGQLAGKDSADTDDAIEEEKDSVKDVKAVVADAKDDEKKKKKKKKAEKVDVSAQLAEKQAALADRLAYMVAQAQARHKESKNNVELYTDFGTSIMNLRNTINKPEYMHTPSLYSTSTPAVGMEATSGLKGEIRSLKGILLNRRRFD